MQIALLYTLFPSAMEASDVSQKLLTEGLIACANRMAPCVSHYMWEDALHSEEEYPVLFKTAPDAAEAAMERLRSLHSYDTPAITAWLAEGTAQFAGWVKDEVSLEKS